MNDDRDPTSELFEGGSRFVVPPMQMHLTVFPDDFHVFGTPENFWWTNSIALMWNHLDNPNVAMWPSIDDDQQGRGIWMAALDLLAFGNGWVDVRRELNYWALGRFQVVDEPILGRLRRDLGASLLALIWYLNKHDYVAEWIENYLTSFSAFSMWEPEQGHYLGQGPEKLNLTHLEKVIKENQIALKYPFTRVLLESGDGSDPAHLSHHFSYEGSSFERSPDADLQWIGGSHFQVHFFEYPHWYRRLHLFFAENLELSVSSVLDRGELPIVDVWIRGIGFIGQFVLDTHRQRFVRNISVLDINCAHRFGARRIDLDKLPELFDEERSTSQELGNDPSKNLKYSEIPPALQKLIKDLVTRVIAKFGEEAVEQEVHLLRQFIDGRLTLSQDRASSEMAQLLRMLT